MRVGAVAEEELDLLQQQLELLSEQLSSYFTM
jgi:hypothetical protein